jgi:hypothetical protein
MSGFEMTRHPRAMLGLDPSISCKRFSSLRFASPENDG